MKAERGTRADQTLSRKKSSQRLRTMSMVAMSEEENEEVPGSKGPGPGYK